MNWIVYILRSENSGRFYTGVTTDIERRLYQHNNGLNRSTRNKGPWLLVWKSEKMPQEDALQLEAKINGRGAVRFIQDMD